MKIVSIWKRKVFVSSSLFALILSSPIYSIDDPQWRNKIIFEIPDDAAQLVQKIEDFEILSGRSLEKSKQNEDILKANSLVVDDVIRRLRELQGGVESELGLSQKENLVGIVDQLKDISDKLNGKQINVLSLDGGGARGYSEALLLCMLTRILNKPIHKIFNNIVATSTGAIMAAAFGTVKHVDMEKPDFGPIAPGSPLSILLQPAPESPYFTPDDVMSFYFKESKEIFSGRGVWGASVPYPDDKLNTLLQKYFSLNQAQSGGKGEAGKETTLSQLGISTSFMVYNDNLGEALLYSTRKAKKHGKYNKEVWEVVRTAVAAPCYFKPVTLLESQYAMGDAGIVANNPIWWGINEAAKEHAILPHECVVFSVGGGRLDESKGADYYIALSGTNFSLSGESMLMNFVLNRAFDGYARHKEIKKYMKLYHKNKWQEHYYRWDPMFSGDLFVTNGTKPKFFLGQRDVSYEAIEACMPELSRFAKILSRDKSLEAPQALVSVNAGSIIEELDVHILEGGRSEI